MKKGEKRKREILLTAERLFYSMGYEKTTVQDIIDALGLSKGGFYHHFESKEDLISILCEEKIEEASIDAVAAVRLETGAVDMLNTLLDKSSVFKEEHIDFIGLLIRVAYRDNNLLMREKMRRKMQQHMLPFLNDIIREGLSQGVFFTPYPNDMGKIVLSMINALDDEIAEILLETGSDQNSLMQILGRLDFYRHIIERLLEAPYASVIIYEMGTLSSVCRAVLDKQRREALTDVEKTQREVLDKFSSTDGA